MCEFCEEGSFFKIMSKQIIDETFIGWEKELLATDLEYVNLDIMFEVSNGAGYIRMGDSEDMGCLDHGEKYKINHCLNCGRKLE